MNRKHFLQSFIPVGLAAAVSGKLFAGSNGDIMPQPNTPAFLKAGDTIGITCPAGPVEIAKMDNCFKAMKKWGLNVKYGNTVGKKWQRFGGTDEERAADFQAMLDDDAIQAILFAKGGYGTMRMIDKINWDKFKQQPKWLIGFSDLTTIHLHVNSNFNIATIHGDMSSGFSSKDTDPSLISLNDALFGKRLQYNIEGHLLNRPGEINAPLVGGNLSMIIACTGSKSEIKTDGKILFIEDVSEYKYTIDRMLMQLKRSGKLDRLAGLLVGQFTATKSDKEDNFYKTVEELIMEKVEEYNYPVCFNFPAGHSKDNRALKFGVPYQFTVTKDAVSLNETSSGLLPSITNPTITTFTIEDPAGKDSTVAVPDSLRVKF
jgi:muramoyltetrapeptide carboxypeptidase